MKIIKMIAKVLDFFRFSIDQARRDWARYRSENSDFQIILQILMTSMVIAFYYFFFFSRR